MIHELEYFFHFGDPVVDDHWVTAADAECPWADFADNVEAAVAASTRDVCPGYSPWTKPLAPRYVPERFEASALHEGDN